MIVPPVGAPRPSLDMSEAELLRVITDAARILGWRWIHHRPAQTLHGWRTPVSGPLGAGWPDLLMVRPRDQRVLLLELKRAGGQATPAQLAVHAVLRDAGLEVRVIRPADLDDIVGALR